MPRVSVRVPLIGAVTDIADANDTLGSWNANSAGIDEVNFRDEGLDRRSVADRAATPADGRARATAVAVAIATVTPIYTPVVTAAAVNAAAVGDMVHVRCAYEFTVSARVAPGDVLLVRLESSTDGAVWTAVPRTDRQHEVFGVAGTEPERGSHCIVHRGLIANATLQYRLAGAIDVPAAAALITSAVIVVRVRAK